MSAPAQAAEVASDEYEVGVGALGIEGLASVKSGRNLLVSGPSLLGPDRVAHAIIERGCRHGEHTVVVTPDVPPSRLCDEIGVAEADGARVHFVDCCAGNESGTGVPETAVERVASPGNLTGIGVGLTKATQSLGEGAPSGVRVALLSLSTLLQYADVNSVFRFVHVATSRFAAAWYLGVATIDSGMHEAHTLNKLKAQFDGAIELRDTDSGPEYRVVGVPGADGRWASF